MDGSFHVYELEQAPDQEDDRPLRFRRYAQRDGMLETRLVRYLEERLIADPGFRTAYERSLIETEGAILCRLLFSGRDEWACRKDLADRQQDFPAQDVLRLEEALAQLFPKLRRGKFPAVAKAHALAIRRAANGRLTGI